MPEYSWSDGFLNMRIMEALASQSLKRGKPHCTKLKPAYDEEIMLVRCKLPDVSRLRVAAGADDG
jgi:hypothetical protein